MTVIPPVTPPVQPVVEQVGGSQVLEVTSSTTTAHCHHTAHCLTPLRVGDLVVARGLFFALLDHLDSPPTAGVTRGLGAGGVPRRL